MIEEFGDYDLIEEALGGISEDFERHWDWFTYGENSEYNVDVNVMIRKTLQGLFGKEETLKAIRQRFCIDMTLEIFAMIAKDSEESTPILSLDDDIVAFLHKSGVRMKLDYFIRE